MEVQTYNKGTHRDIYQLGVCLTYPDSDNVLNSKSIIVLSEGELSGVAALTCRVTVGQPRLMLGIYHFNWFPKGARLRESIQTANGKPILP